MIRLLVIGGLWWSGMALCGAADGPQMVAVSVTIASSSSDKLTVAGDATAMARLVETLEQQQALTSLTRIKLSALEEQSAQFQFGETVSVVVGRTMTFAPTRPDSAGGPSQRGGPTSVANYQSQQTGTMVLVTPRVVENGVLAEFSVEQSRYDHTRAAGDEPPTTPPPKPLITLKSTVLIPREGPALLGGFERTVAGVQERTVVLVTATTAGPPVAAAQKAKAAALKIFALRFADCVGVQNTLSDLFPQRQFQMAADGRSNSLLIQAAADEMATVEAIILRLDEAPPAANNKTN